MKMSLLKKVIALFTLILGMNVSTFAQEAATEPTEEIQPLLLTENKITFYSLQIDFESIKVEVLGETSGELELPQLILSSDKTTITIDFSECETGTFILSGTRGELALQYLIEHKK